jgi:hypothetical protein
VKGHQTQDNDNQSDEDMISPDSEDRISNAMALECINKLKKYFCQKSDELLAEKFNDIRKSVTTYSLNYAKQTKITDYFNKSH